VGLAIADRWIWNFWLVEDDQGLFHVFFVIGHDGRWYLFYTGTSKAEGGLVQRVGMAWSDDLGHWERHPSPLIEADPRSYVRLGDGEWVDEAWRDPCETERDGEQVDHDAAVNGEELVVGRFVDELEAGSGQLGPDDAGKSTADRGEEEGRDGVGDAERLVVGRRQPAGQGAGQTAPARWGDADHVIDVDRSGIPGPGTGDVRVMGCRPAARRARPRTRLAP